jgi:hypothetical protein
LDIKQGEKVEGELDILIARRHEKRVAEQGERAELEAWQLSARVEEERERRENAAAWCDYRRHLQTLHQGLADEHGAAVAKLEKLLESEADGDLPSAA